MEFETRICVGGVRVVAVKAKSLSRSRMNIVGGIL